MKPSSGIAAVFVFVVIGATVSQSQAAPAALRGLRSEIRRYDCEYKGKGYSEGEWAVDCDAKYDMCQCVYDWNKGKHVWDNCRDDPKKCSDYQSCSDCVWDGNDYKFCVAEKHCSSDCDTCKKYESEGYCEFKGYCEASNPWSPVTKFNKLSNTACGFGGYAVEGADMSRYEDVSVSWCRNKCSKEKNCYGFDYDDDKTRCRVFHEYPWSQKYKKGVTCYLAEKKGGNSW